MTKDGALARMTVGEHIEELRRRVIRSLLYLAVALALCFTFNAYVVGYILKQPYEVLMERLQEVRDRAPEETPETGAGAGGGAMSDPVPPPPERLPTIQVLGPTEAFITWLKVGLMTALLLASPLMARELWGFVAAGLYPHEKKYVRIFAPVSYLLFLAGVAFLYFVVLPSALKFLFSFGTDPIIPGVPAGSQVVVPMPQYAKYVSFYISMSLIMGVVFQLPLVVIFFITTGIVQAATFSKYRRHFIVGAVVVLAVISPTGDAPTLVLISLPVVLLYEGGLLFGRFLVRGRKA